MISRTRLRLSDGAFSIDAMVDAAQWTPEVRARLSYLYQGALVDRPPLVYYGDGQAPLTTLSQHQPVRRGGGPVVLGEARRAPYGIVLNQTCDIVEEGPPKRPWVQVSPVYFFPCTAGEARQIEARQQFDYLFWISSLGTSESGAWVADLRLSVPVEKGWFVGRQHQPAFLNPGEAAAFAERIGYLLSRPAVPLQLADRFIQPFLEQRARLVEEFGAVAQCETRYNAARDRDDPISVEPVILSDGALSTEIKERWRVWWDNEFGESQPTTFVVRSPRFATYAEIDPREYEQLVTARLEQMSRDI
jgi:hypothetical protein